MLVYYNMLFIPSKFELNPLKFAIFVNGAKKILNFEMLYLLTYNICLTFKKLEKFRH